MGYQEYQNYANNFLNAVQFNNNKVDYNYFCIQG